MNHLQQEKLSDALYKACLFGNYKIVIPLVEAGADNFEQCLSNGQHLNHILAYLRLCQAAHEGDRTAIQLLLERDDSEIVDHPRYPALLEHHEILMPLLDNGKLSVTTPIRVALRAGHILAAGDILLRSSKHPSSGMVDWHGHGLESLHSEWLRATDYPDLSFICLSFNRLRQIPLEINNFKNLVKLQLASNQITFVLSEIFQLAKIEHIDLSFNTISALPEALLGHVSPSLAVLDLSNNQLTTLPAYFEGSGIQQLNLSHNLLREVPRCVCGMRQLKTLDLSKNIEITHIPYELGGLRQLEILSVAGLAYVLNIPQRKDGSVLDFLQQRFRSMQTVTHYELVIVGFHNHSRSLQIVHKFLLTANIKCSILKFENPIQFLYLQQIFQLPNTVYLVLWDCQNRQDPNELHQVLRHISIYSPNAPIIVAACWKSFLHSHSELAAEDSISHSLWKDLADTVILKHVSLEAKEVLSEEGSLEGLARLIKDVAERVQSTLFVPGSYYNCIEVIRRSARDAWAENRAPMLTEVDFWGLVSSVPSYDLSSIKELPDLVSFLTAKAAVLHVACTCRNIQDLYILDRQWFCDVLGQVVYPRSDVVAFRNFSAVVLQEGIIDLLNCPLLQQPLPNALRVFVNQHGIALALSSEKWLVPCMLKSKADELTFDFTPQIGLRRQYTFRLTPISLWGRLIAHLLINMESFVRRVSRSESNPVVFPWVPSTLPSQGVIDWTYWASGIICWQNACHLVYSIEAIGSLTEPYMEGFEIQVPNTPQGCQTMQILCFVINSLLSNWHPTIWASVEVWVPCSYCLHTQNPDVPSISFQDCILAVSKGVGVKCLQHPEKVVSIAKIVPDLFQEDINKDYFFPPGSVEFNPHDRSSCLSAPPSETVFKGICSKQLVAVKPYPHPVPNRMNDMSSVQPPPFLSAWQEVEAIQYIKLAQSPFLLDMIGMCPDPLCVILPFAKWCSLEEIIVAKEIMIPHLVRMRMVHQLATALEALHSLHVIHRNVSLANILVFSLSADDDVNIRLGGFSEACYGIFQGVGKGFHGHFPAPEMFKPADGEYDERVDIFAFAFVAYEIITRSLVHIQTSIPLQIVSAFPERPSLAPIRARAPYLVPLLNKCWAADTTKRPFMSEVVSHLRDPLHMVVRNGQSINEEDTFFAGAAKFTRVRDSFHADVFICSGPLSGEGTTCLTHISLPGLISKNCTSIPSEYVICMCCVGSQLWVSFYGKKVRVYCTSTLNFISEFKFKFHVVAMAVSPTTVYLGLDNGVLQMYDVSNQNVPTEPAVTKNVSQGKPFKCIEPLEDSLVVATKNTIFSLNAETLDIETRWPVVAESEIRSVVMTEFGDSDDTLWISFRRLDRIKVLSAQTGSYCYIIECSKVFDMNPSEVSVLTMRVVLDTVWVGLNTGHILVFSSSPAEPFLLTYYKVHQADVRHLLLLHPSYMGPTSIPFAVNDTLCSPIKSHEASLTSQPPLPESVFVLSCGQGLHEPLPVLDGDGALVSAEHQGQSQPRGGLHAVVLEGMSEFRAANLERSSGREPTFYMMDQVEESPYDNPPNEPHYENTGISRAETWSASTSGSPVFSKKLPSLNSFENSYSSIHHHKGNQASTALSSNSHVSTTTKATHPSPVPLDVAPPPLPASSENKSWHSKRADIYHTAAKLFPSQTPPSPPPRRTPGLVLSPIPRTYTSPSPEAPPRRGHKRPSSLDQHWEGLPELLDSCEPGEFDPYVRMNAIMHRETQRESPPDSPDFQDLASFLGATKPPPIPPRSPKQPR